MIVKWQDKEAFKIWNMETSRRIPIDVQQRARQKLIMIDAATSLNDLKSPPSNSLEALKHERKGQYSIRINNQWRICLNGTPEKSLSWIL
ncbi:type II toxin-antitoxin system RelE/ParE family toxin [Treponema sp. OMZ 788]|uniref:type II toxin-antitoxin system RelE/ParE family toxin n=1 Tax=Treponema sp. OMZ 788 TaxID=2563664 RepID=UPI0020A3A82E|nr:type II toxin-antitoxin system RelE/ParE family toxin [Treponema sp. OMZ 788]